MDFDRDRGQQSNRDLGRDNQRLGRQQLAGQYAGRGPKGYQRSDERIKEDVCDCLTRDPQIDASDIEVQVKNCEVTLTGTVSDRNEKRRVEDVIDDVSGIKEIHNQIRVQQRQQNQSQQNMSEPSHQGGQQKGSQQGARL
jgi:hypothetical protein